MPAAYAHRRFGEELISYLPPSFQKGLAPYMDTFFLGTEGPDVMFYHQPLKSNPVRKKASTMHYATGKSFFLRQGNRLLTEKLVKKEGGGYVPDSADAAYILGFLCHYLVDVHLHPLVYELEETGVPHGRIESEFDKVMLRKDGKPIRGYNTTSPLGNEPYTVKACAAALDIQEHEAAKAIKTMKKINGYFSSKNPLLHCAFHSLLTIMGVNKKFGSMFLYKKDDPKCAETVLKMRDAWENTLPKAARIAEDYFQNLDTYVKNGELPDIFEHGYTGEYCPNGKPCQIK